jgi:hypothetical protein
MEDFLFAPAHQLATAMRMRYNHFISAVGDDHYWNV